MWITLLLASAQLAQATPTVLAVSGGASPMSNHSRYYKNIKRIKTCFPDWNISNIMANGPSDDQPNCLEAGIHGGYIFDSKGIPKLTRIVPQSNYDGAAKFETIQKILKSKLGNLKPGEPLLLYFTDHGRANTGPEQREISLWGEHLSVEQLRGLLELVPKSNPTVMLHDQCYGGGMLESLWKDGKTKPNTCGFAAALASQVALNGGGLAEAIEDHCIKKKSGEPCSFSEVYYSLKSRASWHHNSTPISSSDFYLLKYLQKHPVDPKSQIPENQTCIDCTPSVLFDRITKLNGLATESYQTLLHERLLSIKREMKKDCKAIHDFELPCETIEDHLEKITKRLAPRRARLEKAFDEGKKNLDTHLSPKMNAAFKDWLHQTHAEFYSDYIKVKDKIDALTNSKDSTLSNPQSVELTQLQEQFKPLKERFDIYFDVALNPKHSHTDFMQKFTKFLNDSGKHPVGVIYNKDTISENQEQDEVLGDIRTQLQPILALSDHLTTLKALQTMVEGEDTKSLGEYFNLLECENTLINLPEPENKRPSKRKRSDEVDATAASPGQSKRAK